MRDQTPAYSAFVDGLLTAVPELLPLFDQHMDDYDELLEHVFMGEVTRFSVKAYREDSKSGALKRLIRFLDEAFLAEDARVQELICVSFLENLPQSERLYAGLKDLLTEPLRGALALYEADQDP